MHTFDGSDLLRLTGKIMCADGRYLAIYPVRPRPPPPQSKRFMETAHRFGVDEAETGYERAFGKVGLKKPKKARRKK
jgi:hypothetical protein